MTAAELTVLIKDTFAAGLPAELAAASLDNFDEYRDTIPARSDDLELCVYVDFDDDETDRSRIGFLVQAQLYRKDQAQEYHSVIKDFILKNITPNLVDYETREAVSADIWPMDINSSTSFVFYSIIFVTSLDDCAD